MYLYLVNLYLFLFVLNVFAFDKFYVIFWQDRQVMYAGNPFNVSVFGVLVFVLVFVLNVFDHLMYCMYLHLIDFMS